MQYLNDLDQSFRYVEASRDLPLACMPDAIKRLLEVYEVVECASVVGYSL